MPKERKKVLCMDAQRHAEYYGMQRTFDELYAKSKAGETFIGLMELVLSPNNIMLAYRNIKTNTGSYQQEQTIRISVTLDGFHRLRSSVRSEKLSQAANTATVPNQCAGRTSQSQTEKPGRWVFPASGTDWCSSASNKSWNPSVKLSSATTAMGFARIGRWSTQFPVLTPCCNGRTCTMFWSLTSKDSLTM